MTRRAALALIAVIAIIACARVAATHAVFSPTWDEPAHIDMGYVYLTQHVVYFTDHPPLGRAVAAFPLRHAAVDPHDPKRWIDVCASAGDLMAGVVRSRRAMLVFLFAAIAAAGWWGMLVFGPVTGVLTSAVLALIPSILAHGGLSTTDMPATAGFALAGACFQWWLPSSTWTRTGLLGVALGIAALTKFTVLPFFGIAAAVMLVRNRRRPDRKLAAALVIALLVVWLAYFREVKRISQIGGDARTVAHQLLGNDWFATTVRLPAARYVFGILQTLQHNREGHGSFFMGRVRDAGTWVYFPVLFAIKTPIPILAALVFGLWRVRRAPAGVEIAVIAAALLLFLLPSRINIGIRHALPLYVPLAMLAAYGASEAWRSMRLRVVAGALAAWLMASSVLAHPDYLPWANAFAGRDPAWFALDSNYDWGQDFLRLAAECRKRHITQLGANLFGMEEHEAIGLPPTHPIDEQLASTGWIAVSENNVRSAQARNAGSYRWLTEPFRYERVGKTIRLYSVP
ncbi:MAG TPA: hypothetical protein VJZ76_00180 [Thermoanaerobaculia bacterium]|nr:hypothetical protein [Thermoanaerobaculia bacterium]